MLLKEWFSSIILLSLSVIIFTVLAKNNTSTVEQEIERQNDSGKSPINEKGIVIHRNVPEDWKEYLFPEDEVIEIRIIVEDSQWKHISENAIEETNVPATILFNGQKLENIGFRPKGNSSLLSAVIEGKNQYSFKLSFDEYFDQNLFGIRSISLNNCMGDPTFIREKLAYEMIEEMGLPVPQTVFCNVFINDELIGLYLAVQRIDEVMMSAWFEEGTGDLYKPDGAGADLHYISDKFSDYSGMILKSNKGFNDKNALLKLIYHLNHDGEVESVLDVESFLKYLAVSTTIINLDSYQGGMFHNYYLYEQNGQFIFLPWDFNLTFMPFGSQGIDVIDPAEFLIDEPTTGPVENYPLIDKILSVPEYRDLYHKYINDVIKGPMEIDNLSRRANELYELIDRYIYNDSVPQSSYEEFKNGLYDTERSKALQSQRSFNIITSMINAPGLLSFAEKRVNHIHSQLAGTVPSTNNGMGNNTGGMGNRMNSIDGGGLKVQNLSSSIDMDLLNKLTVNMNRKEMQIMMGNRDRQFMSGKIKELIKNKELILSPIEILRLLLGKKGICYLWMIILSFMILILSHFIKNQNKFHSF
ncbi:MAG: CotH kinase family protein [Spirochaetaceae bacterium]|nr:CotH kinase family protein [Spirochaetaceae bacterium]